MKRRGTFWASVLPLASAGTSLLSLATLSLSASGAIAHTASPPALPTPEDPASELVEIMVEARGPRFVAPTLHDQIGRIWAPVFINGKGPFRLVLDTGATSSGVTAAVALALGIPTDHSPPMMLRGVTGSAVVPAIHVDTLTVGDVEVDSPILPILPDALGGAEGVLGSEGLSNKRLFIDFRYDQIVITYSRGERAERGFVTIPFHSIRGHLIAIRATVGQVHVEAIIDTGGQRTIGNLALRDALIQNNLAFHGDPDQIIGTTLAKQNGEMIATPAIQLGGIEVLDPGVTYANLDIFKKWNLLAAPAMMIGMDAIGTLDTLVIDYRRHELQMRMRKAG